MQKSVLTALVVGLLIWSLVFTLCEGGTVRGISVGQIKMHRV